MAKIAINGFGRIGRAFYKLALARPELELVVINDLGDPEMLAYLLQYDSTYKKYEGRVSTRVDGDKHYLVVDTPEGKHVETLFIQQKDATQLPWRDLGIDIAVESTGVFESFEKASVHKQSGAKRVVITAPAKDEDGPDQKTILVGINDDAMSKCTMTSTGSCTTNSASPVMEILSEKIGIKKAFLNTVHAYTGTQNLIDGPVKGKDYRRGRAAAQNISPSTTGAAIAVTRVIGSLKGKFDGVALRVPVPTGSISAITFLAARPTTAEEINKSLTEAANSPRWKDILEVTNDQVVSTDIVGDPHPAIVDLSLTKVVDGDLCAVYSWYDNEFGYTNALVEHVVKAAQAL